MTEESWSFRLDVARAEGALERVLGVVRRRGLGIERLSVDPAADGTWSVAIEAAAVQAEAGLALRQLTALVDVRSARLDGPMAG